MEFTNKTPFTSELFIGKVEGTNRRIGMIVAKGTYIVEDGKLICDSDSPYPIFKNDEQTPLGILPRDNLPKKENFDVIVLGKAYAPGGAVTKQMVVSLTIGNITHDLMVFGNRKWVNRAEISNPEPFDVMPLTYENAFGGQMEVEIDDESFVPISDPRNPKGKGFNVEPHIESISTLFNPPGGFPKYPQLRELPNIEDPQNLIRDWKDSPDPVCWATLPLTSSLHVDRSLKKDLDQVELTPGFYCRSNPKITINEIHPGIKISLFGMNPKGEFKFNFPDSRINVEFILNGKYLEKQLKVDTIVILPEENRFYVVARFFFNYVFIPNKDRVARLKIDSRIH